MKTKSADALVKGDVIFLPDFPTWGVTVNTVEVKDTHDIWYGKERIAVVNGTLKRADGQTFENILTYVLPIMVTLK
jgi:hypothetical protein